MKMMKYLSEKLYKQKEADMVGMNFVPIMRNIHCISEYYDQDKLNSPIHNTYFQRLSHLPLSALDGLAIGQALFGSPKVALAEYFIGTILVNTSYLLNKRKVAKLGLEQEEDSPVRTSWINPLKNRFHRSAEPSESA